MGLLDHVRQFAQDVHMLAQGTSGSSGSPMPGNSGGSPGGKLSPFPINEEVSVTLDGSGNGTARITPGQPARGGGVGAGRNSGLSWALTAANVSASTFT